MKVVALIPAHNEEATIAATVESMLAQQRRPDRIIVLCDNCSDRTKEVAEATGAETYVTKDNREMKAGALNQALNLVIPTLAPTDIVICMDADSIVGDNFVSESIRKFGESGRLGGVSGTYIGTRGGGLVGWCQRNEFARWGFDNRNEHGHTVILSGACSAFRVRALERVRLARESGELGGSDYYDVNTITEDFELSVALVTTGSTIVNLMNVIITTSVKPTWRELFTQRLRWDRGINETLFDYGVTPVTRIVWFRRVMYAFFVPVSFMCLFLISYRVAAGNALAMNGFWVFVSLLMCCGKALTIVRLRGWRNAALAFLIVPELPYDTFLQLCFVRSLLDQATGHSKRWR
jgi:cellulose synthase/poly-beta-1,6-N-acetylglucosamine synthase-like glycosyltransferase